jgi:cytochrome c553
MNKFLTPLFALLVASALGSLAHAQEVKGDAKVGATKIAMCAGCHSIPGYQASFPEIYKVPKISGQNAAYIVAALKAYQQGERKHPSMRGVVDNLSDQDLADIAVYYQTNGQAGAKPLAKAAPASAAVEALLTKGACASCHGDTYNNPILPSYPKLAGQHADYLYVALKAYKTTNNPRVGRNNAIMGGIAGQFSNAELKTLARYLSALPGELQAVPESRFR